MEDVGNLDLYGLLELQPDCTEEEIVKSYRKKARRCHPDKNPDDPDAARLFREISRALEVLSDTAARAAYDRVRRAKQATAERNARLDAERKKLKEDLEARERAAMQRYDPNSQSNADGQLAKEIERLRKAGSKLLESEKARLAAELRTAKEGNTKRTDRTDTKAPDTSTSQTGKPSLSDSQFDDLEMAVLMRMRQAAKSRVQPTTSEIAAAEAQPQPQAATESNNDGVARTLTAADDSAVPRHREAKKRPRDHDADADET